MIGGRFAISTRDDLSWGGEKLEAAEAIAEKQNQIRDHAMSMKLYDWFNPHATEPLQPLPAGSPNQPIQIWSTRQGTQQVVEQVFILECNMILLLVGLGRYGAG